IAASWRSQQLISVTADKRTSDTAFLAIHRGVAGACVAVIRRIPRPCYLLWPQFPIVDHLLEPFVLRVMQGSKQFSPRDPFTARFQQVVLINRKKFTRSFGWNGLTIPNGSTNGGLCLCANAAPAQERSHFRLVTAAQLIESPAMGFHITSGQTYQTTLPQARGSIDATNDIQCHATGARSCLHVQLQH
ncbi:MAG: hypothetical protein AAFW60_08330, partial [Pseudomonadota bacterium]